MPRGFEAEKPRSLQNATKSQAPRSVEVGLLDEDHRSLGFGVRTECSFLMKVWRRSAQEKQQRWLGRRKEISLLSLLVVA